MNILKLYGGTLGAAMVIPAALTTLMATSIGQAMRSAFRESTEKGFTLEIVLSALALVLATASPALTVLNVAKPENSLRKVSAALVSLAGLISVSTILYGIINGGFSLILAVVLLGGAALLASGILQLKD